MSKPNFTIYALVTFAGFFIGCGETKQSDRSKSEATEAASDDNLDLSELDKNQIADQVDKLQNNADAVARRLLIDKEACKKLKTDLTALNEKMSPLDSERATLFATVQAQKALKTAADTAAYANIDVVSRIQGTLLAHQKTLDLFPRFKMAASLKAFKAKVEDDRASMQEDLDGAKASLDALMTKRSNNWEDDIRARNAVVVKNYASLKVFDAELTELGVQIALLVNSTQAQLDAKKAALQTSTDAEAKAKDLRKASDDAENDRLLGLAVTAGINLAKSSEELARYDDVKKISIPALPPLCAMILQ